MNPIIVKFGGSAITDKDEKFSLDEKTLNRLVDELKPVNENIVIVHGGGSFGHPLAAKYRIKDGYSKKDQLIGFSKTHKAMEELNAKIVRTFIESGQAVFPVQTSACTVVKKEKIISIEIRNMKKLLELGIIPILYGDCVTDLEKGMTILSGDQLVAYLADELKAKKVILCTDIDGVFDKNPKKYEDAKLIPKITPTNWEKIVSSISSPPGDDVTGGMKNKVEVFLELAKKGIESQLINSKKVGTLKKALKDDIETCTKISKG